MTRCKIAPGYHEVVIKQCLSSRIRCCPAAQQGLLSGQKQSSEKNKKKKNKKRKRKKSRKGDYKKRKRRIRPLLNRREDHLEKCEECSIGHKINNHIEKMVVYISKLVERGSIIFNHLLNYVYSQVDNPDNSGKKLEDLLIDLDNLNLYIQCFTIGTIPAPGSTREADFHPTLAEFFNEYGSLYPVMQREPHDRQIITYAAQTYMTNFHNSIAYNLRARQMAMLKAKLCLDLDKKTYRMIQGEINGRYFEETEAYRKLKLDEDLQGFIDAQRQAMGANGEHDGICKLVGTETKDDPIEKKRQSGRVLNPEYGVSSLWLSRHMKIASYLNYYILSQSEYLNSKIEVLRQKDIENTGKSDRYPIRLFDLAPMGRCGRRCISLDKKYLSALAKDLGFDTRASQDKFDKASKARASGANKKYSEAERVIFRQDASMLDAQGRFELFSMFFNLKGIVKGQKVVMGGIIDTDGVCICVHVDKRGRPVIKPKTEKKTEKKTKSKAKPKAKSVSNPIQVDPNPIRGKRIRSRKGSKRYYQVGISVASAGTPVSTLIYSIRKVNELSVPIRVGLILFTWLRILLMVLLLTD